MAPPWLRLCGTQPGLLQSIPVPEIHFRWVHLDHLGPLPTTFSKKTHILVIVDRLTKFSFLEAVGSTSAKETVAAFQKFIDEWGVPAQVTVDRGTAFTAELFQNLLRKFNVKLHSTCPRRPQANGQVEHVNGVITPLLAKMVHNGKSGLWDRLLKKVQLFPNPSVNKSTGETPIRLLCGFNPEVPDQFLDAIAHPSTRKKDNPVLLREEARKRIETSFQEAKKHYDKRHVAADALQRGDIVWFRAPIRNSDGTSRKLDAKYRGPLMVTRKLKGD